MTDAEGDVNDLTSVGGMPATLALLVLAERREPSGFGVENALTDRRARALRLTTASQRCLLVLAERREPSGFGVENALTDRRARAQYRSIDKVLTSAGPVGSRQTADIRL
uniref:hypothetical protein n=1 Tax=Stieleria sp. TaxID=2795976 RepID=UPI0035678BF7